VDFVFTVGVLVFVFGAFRGLLQVQLLQLLLSLALRHSLLEFHIDLYVAVYSSRGLWILFSPTDSSSSSLVPSLPVQLLQLLLSLALRHSLLALHIDLGVAALGLESTRKAMHEPSLTKAPSLVTLGPVANRCDEQRAGDKRHR
jgi:hypothetical protein